MAYPSGSSAQRIRIGLTGLAIAFLLVLAGSVISSASEDDAGPPAANAEANETEPNEPLAELGVAPGASEPDANNSSEK